MYKKICSCGCGEEIVIKKHHSWYGTPKYIDGHYSKTKQHRNQISKLLKNVKFTIEHKQKIGKALTGRKRTREHCKNIGLAKKGKPSGHKGHKHTEETKKKIRTARANQVFTNETREKLSKSLSLENNPRWIDGRSFEPYPLEFKKIRKTKIIFIRDNYTCQLCNDYLPERRRIKHNPNKNWLTIHHIDYNKQNNSLINLITLCNFCNISVNTQRNEWTKFFQENLQCQKAESI